MLWQIQKKLANTFCSRKEEESSEYAFWRSLLKSESNGLHLYSTEVATKAEHSNSTIVELQ